MLGDKVSAVEAERMGMVYKVFADDVFQQEALKMAGTLAQMPTKGLALTKQAFSQSLNNSLEQQLKIEEELQVKAGQTKDYKEGVDSFLQKRKPSFKGE